ncbi:MAG TPA: hypothetical protein DCG23_01190, partial [Deltaproteobacteria bacterium]|nr:hypothetical protein [Deltaproteobacteria bacterium]
MKIPNFAGTVRRSQMVTTYGPGAIVNLKSPRGCPISAVTSGLDFWDLEAKPAGLKNRQKCFLSRLQKKLDVDGFRLPPVSLDTRFYIEETPLALPAKRFPDWLTCPKCYRLKHSNKWQKSTTVSSADRWCGRCSSKKEKVFVVPVRFILSCENGHLTEFPWVWWLKTFGSVKAYSKTKDDK